MSEDLIGMSGNNPAGMPPQIKINPDDLEKVICECGGEIFDRKFRLLKLSPLVSPTGEGGLIPTEVVVCIKCNKELEF